MYVDVEMCEKFGLDPAVVLSIARRISKAAREAHAIGLEVFGGSGSGSLRFSDAETQGPGHNDVASLDGYFDGGDGGDVFDSLTRGDDDAAARRRAREREEKS